MKQHGNSSLTIAQRKLIQELYRSGKAKKSELVKRFQVNRKTIDRWLERDTPYDLPSGPKDHYTVITPAYQKAVIEHRKTNPDHGPLTIAYYLKEEYSFANQGTVYRILQREDLIKPNSKSKKSNAL